MAIISFWSGDNKESGQTLSAAAVATLMALEHNYRVLLIDATFSDDTLERCFWKINAKKEENGDLKDSIKHFLGLDGLKMIRYLELIEYICLVISISNFIAIGLTLKKKKQIFKTMYFINNFGVVTISNLIIWTEGWYVDENNLSGSTMSFFLNFCNIALFILNNIMIINCKKT